MELRDAPSSRLFLNRIWLQDVAFRPYLSHSRNPIWRPENRKFFEINLKKDMTTTDEIAPATPIFTTTPVSAMTLADTRNSKWRPPKSFSFQNSESGVVEMWGVAVETASPSPSVQKLIISASILQFAVCTCRFSSVKPPFWLLLLLAYAFSCANGTGDRDSCEFGQLVRSFAGAPDG